MGKEIAAENDFTQAGLHEKNNRFIDDNIGRSDASARRPRIHIKGKFGDAQRRDHRRIQAGWKGQDEYNWDLKQNQPAQTKRRQTSNRSMLKIPPLLLAFCACNANAGNLEIKYNLVGAVLSPYAEHGMEMEYSRTKVAIPFLRFALIDRGYDHESWIGEKVGRSNEEGYQLWVGNKARLIPWKLFENLEMLIYYRRSKSRFAYASQGWATGKGKERVSVNAIGTGLSLNMAIGKWIVVEPFWYGDYGKYDVEAVSGSTAPYSPYSYGWDDEHRVGLNLGIRI